MPHGEGRGLPSGVYEEDAHHDGGSLHGAWNDSLWLAGSDGKARRVKSGVRLLANGVPARVGKLRAYGNAIVPQVAAEVIKAFMECEK
jgi:DNA (cytosine-5)-methyltransferase 1